MAKNAKEEALKILDKNMVGTMATVQTQQTTFSLHDVL